MSHCVGIAAPVCTDRHKIFEASTDTSVDDQRDGSEEVAQENIQFLKEKFHKVKSKQKQEGLPNSKYSCQSCDPSLPHSVAKKMDEKQSCSIDEQDGGDQESAEYQQQRQQTCVRQQHYQQPQPSVADTLLHHQQWQQRRVVNSAGQFQQVKQGDGGDQLNCQQQTGLESESGLVDQQQLNHLSAQLRSVLDFSRLPSLEEALSPSGIVASNDKLLKSNHDLLAINGIPIILNSR